MPACPFERSNALREPCPVPAPSTTGTQRPGSPPADGEVCERAAAEVALCVWEDRQVERAIDVRPFVSADRSAVLNLVPRLTIGVAPWRDHVAVAAAVRGWIDKSTEPNGGGAAFVAVAERGVVGFVSVASIEHFAGERDAYIGELIVDEAFEGRGAGRRLIAAAEQWAREAGYRCITLDTGAANSRAREFYSRLGYCEEDVKLTRILDELPDPGRA